MDIWSQESLTLFIAFVIPGFISIKLYYLFFPSSNKSSQDQLIDAIAYSSINYAILAFPIFLVEHYNVRHNCLWGYYLFYTFVIFLAPIVWVFVWKKLRECNKLQKYFPHPTEKPWDYFFSKRQPCWVKVTLKNNEVIGGLFSTDSFASSGAAAEQIYIQEVWVINEKGVFERKVNDSKGVIILSSEISHIQFRQYKES